MASALRRVLSSYRRSVGDRDVRADTTARGALALIGMGELRNPQGIALISVRVSVGYRGVHEGCRSWDSCPRHINDARPVPSLSPAELQDLNGGSHAIEAEPLKCGHAPHRSAASVCRSPE